MVVFLDTSALYALADRDDLNHTHAKTLFENAQQQETTYLLHNYILLECAALFSRRLGPAAARRLLQEAEAFRVRWVDERLHCQALKEWKSRPARLSFVDQVSFAVMREAKVHIALAFDDDFKKEGFSFYSG